MKTIKQCRVRQVDSDVAWWRVEWLPTRDAFVGNVVTVDGVVIRDGKVYKDVGRYEVVTVYSPAMPEDTFKKQEN